MASTKLSFEGQGTCYTNTASINPGTVAAASVELTCTIADTNAKVGDIISVSSNVAFAAGLMIGAPYCAIAGTIVVPVVNPTASGVAQGASTVSYSITRAANS